MRFLAGIVVGIVISTIGFSTLAQYLDRGVDFVQQTTKEAVK